MKITIWDSTQNRCEANQKALSSAATVLSIAVEIQTWTDSRAPQNGSLSPQCDLLLLHSPTDEAVAIKWFLSKSIALARILKFGGREVAGGVPRAVSETEPFKDFEAKGILEAVRDSANQETFIERALAIWSAVPENLLSWALLEKYGMGGLTADVELTNSAERELRQRSGDAATLNLLNAQKTIAEFRADL